MFITLHARDGHEEGLRELTENLKHHQRNLIVLPRPFDLMPATIAARLLESGIPADTPLRTLQRLSLEGEIIAEYTLASLANEDAEFSDLTILAFPMSGVKRLLQWTGWRLETPGVVGYYTAIEVPHAAK